MLKFKPVYLALAIVLFAIEVLIALYAHDAYIRPYGGDFLVVILIYCLLKAFVRVPVNIAVTVVLAFAFFIEGLQYLRIIYVLGLQDYAIARMVIGTSFVWMDLVMYTLGMATVWLVEKARVAGKG